MFIRLIGLLAVVQLVRGCSNTPQVQRGTAEIAFPRGISTERRLNKVAAAECATSPSTCYNEANVKNQIDLMVSSNLVASGYNYLILGLGWASVNRDPTTQNLVPNPTNFPNGIDSLVRYATDRLISVGVQLSAADSVSCTIPTAGSKGNFARDLALLKGWGVKLIELDACGISSANFYQTSIELADANKAQGTTFVLSLRTPTASVRDVFPGGLDSNKINVNYALWSAGPRTALDADIIKMIFAGTDVNVRDLTSFSASGHRFNPDYLQVGTNTLSLDLESAQVAFWCIQNFPMFMSADLSQLVTSETNWLKNENLNSICRDQFSTAELRQTTVLDVTAWFKELSGSKYAIFIYSSLTVERLLSTNLNKFGIPIRTDPYSVIDLYSGKDLGSLHASAPTTFTIPPNSFILLYCS